MQFHVAQLLKSPVGETRRYEIDEPLESGPEVNSTGPVKGSVKLTRTKRGVLVDANFDAQVELECSRCLAQYPQDVGVEVHEEFLPTLDINSGNPIPLDDELQSHPESLAIDDHHILDLDDTVRQYILLGEPLKPLCREDCAGLCPTCGRDLNQGACGCEASTPDSRLAPLADLLRDLDDK